MPVILFVEDTGDGQLFRYLNQKEVQQVYDRQVEKTVEVKRKLEDMKRFQKYTKWQKKKRKKKCFSMKLTSG
jgi:hypothetical protein